MERKTDTTLKEFAKKVKAHYKDAEVFLFGSRAKNDYLEHSDYDVIIVSKGFEGTNFFSRPEKIYDCWSDSSSLDVFCYTPEEFNKKKNEIGFVSEAMKKAKPIAA